EVHLQIRQEDDDLDGRDQADAQRRETIPFDDASAAAADGTSGGAAGVGLTAKTNRDLFFRLVSDDNGAPRAGSPGYASYTMTIFVILPAAAVAVSLFYYMAATVAAIKFAARASAPPPPLPKIPPRVAVLKPLQGTSNSLAANVVSFLEVAYPRLDYFFAVADYEDPAAEIPVALRQRYQFANITLVIGEEPGCSNRKIAKLIKMAERAPKADIFVLSDADVSVDRDYLRRIVAELLADEKTGIVTCAYRARPNGTLASRFEAMYVNTDFIPQVMLAEMIEPMHYA